MSAEKTPQNGREVEPVHEFDFTDEGAWDSVWAEVVPGHRPRLRRQGQATCREDLGNRRLAADVITANFLLHRQDDSSRYVDDRRIEDRLADRLGIPHGTVIVTPGKRGGIAVMYVMAREATTSE